MSTYEPCVLGSDGNCTRWSHDHAGDRPSVTDNARAEAERRYPSDVADRGLTYPIGAVREHSQAAFIAGAEWAAGRAETTTEEWPRCKASRDGGCDRCHDEHGRHIHCRAETTTATDEDAVSELLERMSDAVTRLEALRAEHWDASECQRLHGKIEGVKLAASYVEEARGLLATARTRPTREQIAEHLRKRANDDEDHADRLYTFSAEEWARWYDEHLTVSHQIDGKSLRIEGRPEVIADAVLALLRGGA